MRNTPRVGTAAPGRRAGAPSPPVAHTRAGLHRMAGFPRPTGSCGSWANVRAGAADSAVLKIARVKTAPHMPIRARNRATYQRR